MSEKFYPPEDRDPTASPAPAPEASSEDFDALLRSALPELPPQDVVREVTPLGGTVRLITWGLTLSSVTLNIGTLLPLLMRVSGTLLCLIGFRRLRRENGWFRACYGLAILRLALDWAEELRQTTLLRPPAVLETAVLAVNVLALLALSFCLWRGLLAARRKAGQPPKATAAGALCLWYAILFGVLFLAGGTVTGWFVWLPLLLYLVLLWRLFRLGREMEDSRYVLDPAPVRLTDGKLALLLLTAAAILALCGYTFFTRLPMDWQPDAPVSQEAEAIRQELRDLNFPEEVLQDLSEEDLLACQGATRVVVQQKLEELDGDALGVDRYTGDWRTIAEDWGKGRYDLLSTGVAVQLPAEDGELRWRLFHHFLWVEPRRHPSADCLRLVSPSFIDGQGYDISAAWRQDSDCTGRLLYEEEGVTLTAPYAVLERESWREETAFGWTSGSTDYFAEFSLPDMAENARGYLSYTVCGPGELETYKMESWFCYYGIKNWPFFPAATSRESWRQDSWNARDHYYNMQDMLQFWGVYQTPDGRDDSPIHDPYHSRDDWN